MRNSTMALAAALVLAWFAAAHAQAATCCLSGKNWIGSKCELVAEQCCRNEVDEGRPGPHAASRFPLAAVRGGNI
jgi:hypothetical protein